MIKVEKLSKKFKQKTIFDDINCSLATGKSYAIVGKSGAGKTTFLNILSGLEAPTSGKVMIDDITVNAKNQKKLYRDYCGFIFQNFGLIDTETVKQNLDLGFANQKLSRAEKEAKMKAVLSHLGLDYLDSKQKIYTLSGGEQQRIALARIILKKPQVIFADEPTGSLDAENGKVVLHSLLNDFGSDATVIIATHAQEVWQQCDYVITIENKQIQLRENNNVSSC
ncbi:ATP-binding cassette domain-containing protein [Lactobacillus sp. ESL0679]|uniref:ATP-binding cassette domain-containing protein n=1 Tax=Lactobacillus sp. ESL0679 TaxID=2983209 RepID=UPI0023F67D5D|nr:ATP-binding cassette domain-containing protein [Lactobacillus sp. ESL0679]MDF7683741.1 ATP-binding cassette domain-containing protein [Lactobacillus sp. ESL0679]